MATKMDAAYFIAKFEAIPEENWCAKELHDWRSGRHCALGHLHRDYKISLWRHPEVVALNSVLLGLSISRINDGDDQGYLQPTPRARILAALRDAQKAGR